MASPLNCIEKISTMKKQKFFGTVFYYLSWVLFLQVMISGSAHGEIIPPDMINVIEWNPSQDRIALGRWNGTVEIWNVVSSQLLFTLNGHTDYILGLSWSPDGSQLASSSADQSVRVWNATNGQLIQTLNHIDAAWSVACNSNGSRIFSNSELKPNNLNIWNASTGQLINQYSINGSLAEIILNSDKSKMLLVIPRNVFEIWDTTTLTQLHRFRQTNSSDGDLVGATWSPNSASIATGSYTGKVKIWNATTGAITNTLQGNETAYSGFASQAIRALQYKQHACNLNLFAVSTDGTLRGWNTSTWQVIQNTQLPGSISAAAFSADGSQLAYTDDNNRVQSVDVFQDDADGCGQNVNNGGDVIAVAWSPDGTRIVGGGKDGLLRIWDTEGQTLLDITGLTGFVRSVDWSPDSTKIVSGGDDETIRVWDSYNEELLATLAGHQDGIQGVDWSPDGNLITSVSFDDSKNLRVWDGKTYEQIAVRHTGTLFEITWSPDSTKLVTAAENGAVNIYDSNLDTPSGPRTDGAKFTAKWSPDGTKIASGDSNGQIHIWDASNYEHISILTGHTDRVDAIAFRPNGENLASASNDGTIRIWDVATGETIATFPKPVIFTTSISWSPDGCRLAFGGENGAVEIVDVFQDDAGVCE